jgi:hypothetical protein
MWAGLKARRSHRRVSPPGPPPLPLTRCGTRARPQAEKELASPLWALMKDRLPTTVPIDAWLVANLPKNAKVRCFRRCSIVASHQSTPLTRVGYSDEKVAKRNSRDFGREIAHGAVTRRPPISFDTVVPRTGGYTYDVGVWDLSSVQGPFSVAPCQTLTLRFATFTSLCLREHCALVARHPSRAMRCEESGARGQVSEP